MTALLYSLIAVTIASLISLIGIATLFFAKRYIEDVSHYLIAVSTGALLGAAFLDLLPESFELAGVETTLLFVLGGILFFFIVEKILFWHHCHDGHCDSHEVLPYMVLYGDILHTFIDGVIIAAAFIVDSTLGAVTTLAIVLHEAPHEMADFFVLIHGGFSRTKALAYNFFVALTHYLGVAAVFILYNQAQASIKYLLPIAAGAFIYIAMADLMPELHKKFNIRNAVIQLALILFGIILTTHAVELLGVVH